MFLQRLITSLILVPLVLLLIFYGYPWLLGGIVALIFCALWMESCHLVPLDKLSWQITFFLSLLFCLGASTYTFPYWLVLGLCLWVLIIFAIVSFPASQRYWGYPSVVIGLCCILFPLFIQSLIHLYAFPKGKALLVYLLFLIWATDTGAYLCGKLMGKHKLIPKVSPGKSWEGVLGGVALALCVAVVGNYGFNPANKIAWFFLAFCTAVISIFGDLFISVLKRRCHLKDTGTIIPGHGGVLDRLDSLIAALPLFYFGLTLG